MGNALYSDQVVCHDTLDVCRTHCDKSECIFMDKCNSAGQKFVCVPIDPRFIMWVMVISFLIVLLVCSSLVACYICRAVRATYRYQRDNADSREVNFNNPGRVHHVQYGTPKRYKQGPGGASRY